MKHTNIAKRMLAILLVAALLIPLAACGGSVPTSATLKTAYKAEYTTLSLDLQWVNNLSLGKDSIFFTTSIMDSEGYPKAAIYSMDTDGSNLSEVPYEFPRDTEINGMQTDPDGNLWFVKIVYDWDDNGSEEPIPLPEPRDDDVGTLEDPVPGGGEDTDGEDTDDSADDDGESQAVSTVAYAVSEQDRLAIAAGDIAIGGGGPGGYGGNTESTLCKIDPNGNELLAISLNDLTSESDEGYYYGSMTVDDQGRIYVLLGNGELWVLDPQGKFLFKLTNEKENGYIETVLRSSEGKILVRYSAWSETADSHSYETGLMEVDADARQFGKTYKIPDNLYGSIPGDGYSLYMQSNTGLYGYSLETEEAVEVLNWIDSDISSDNIGSILAISGEKFVCLNHIYEEYESRIEVATLTKLAPEEMQERKLITLACWSLDWDVKSKIIDFNKHSQEYRIRVSEYSIYDTAENNYSGGITQLNNDIISGRIPDILIVNSQTPFDSYVNKGIFADIYTLMDNDPDFNRDDLLPNVLQALERGGKLYSIAPQFNAYTVVGYTKDVGTEMGWTMDDFNALMDSKPDGTIAFDDTTNIDILRYALWLSMDQYIDWNTGKCDFGSDSFIKLLEFANTFASDYDYTKYEDDSYWETYDLRFREGLVLLQLTTFSDFKEYIRLEKGTFGGDITLVGFPTENKNGSSLSIYTEFAISAKSRVQDGAWEFVKSLLSEEYQDDITWQFPVRRSSLEKMAAQAMERSYYEDEEGNKHYYDDTWYIGGQEITIGAMTQDDVDVMMRFIESVNQVMRYNESIMSIIEEETAPYFAGQKNAAAVADIIQNRVQIYVSENR